MKSLTTFLEKSARKSFGLLDIAKREGVYVSRSVLNAEEWHSWAMRHAIPSPVAAADLHVTVIASTIDAKIKNEKNTFPVSVREAAFVMLGEKNDALTVCFESYYLWERHYTYQRAGAVSTWPTYRPHMTLSYDAADFDIPQAAVDDAPDYILLGPETAGPFAKPTADEQDPEGVDTGADATVIIIAVEIAAAAKSLLEGDAVKSPVDRTALMDLAGGGRVTLGVAKRLAGAEWWPYEVGEPAPAAEVRKRVETDVVVKMRAMTDDDAKKIGMQSAIKSDDERHLVYSIANIYSIGGELVKDLDGDSFTTQAMEEWTASVLKKDRSGTFEHDGDLRNTVVQGFVLSDEVQKALGFDLGYEAVLCCTHVPDPDDWAKVKDGTWEQSINGRFWYFED